jgi:hypothetical protein
VLDTQALTLRSGVPSPQVSSPAKAGDPVISN